MTEFRTLLVGFALALTGYAGAPPASAQPTAPYLGVEIDARAFLPPPPAADSAFELAERAIVRGPFSDERRAQALQDNEIDPFDAFDSVLGPNFTGANFPATHTLLERVFRVSGYAGEPVKTTYRRLRPFLNDPAIATCIPADDRLRASFSYPSGQAAVGFAWALTLAELIPSRADALIERGRDYGWSRVVCGLHYPSDVDAGRIVAAAAIARLHADAEFRRDMDAARAELARAFPE